MVIKLVQSIDYTHSNNIIWDHEDDAETKEPSYDYKKRYVPRVPRKVGVDVIDTNGKCGTNKKLNRKEDCREDG